MRLDPSDRDRNALEAARRYYIDNATTPQLAKEFDVSRSTISRWLTLARNQGWVRIEIAEMPEHSDVSAQSLVERFALRSAVSVPVVNRGEALSLVARRAEAEVRRLVHDEFTIGIAWGTTMAALAGVLSPAPASRCVVVQLNGAGTVNDLGLAYAEDILGRFSRTWDARELAFPVPAFFDHASTRDALWRERSINRVREYQRSCDVAIFSIGSAVADVPSRVYEAGYLDDEDLGELRAEGVVGDIATNFFRRDGSHGEIRLNRRASGIPLDELVRIPVRLGVVSGLGKAEALAAALRGGFLTHLVADAPLMAAVAELTGEVGSNR